jgi:hypothetical protein
MYPAAMNLLSHAKSATFEKIDDTQCLNAIPPLGFVTDLKAIAQ